MMVTPHSACMTVHGIGRESMEGDMPVSLPFYVCPSSS